MSLSQFLHILKARYKIILLTMLVIVAATVGISVLMSKTYKATNTVIINYKGVDPVTGLASPAQLLPGYMATQVDIISSKHVALKVIDQLKLAESEGVKASFEEDGGEGDINDWLVKLLLKNLDVSPSRTSSTIDINFKGSNPQFASVMANAFAAEYIRTNIQLKVEPSRQASEYFTQQVKGLKEDLNNAQLRLSQYQQEKGIISVDERLDVERARLNELSSQLVIIQAQTLEAQSRQRNSSGASAYDSPDVAANPLIQGLKTDIARAESKFADISQKVDRNHPSYLGAKAEIDNLKQELNRQIQAVSVNVASNYRILKQREDEIRAALNNQRAKVLELNKDRDALTVLTREVENAQNAYELITQRYTQTNVEGQSNQSDISVLNPATPPIEPDSPKLLLNTVIAIFLGGLLGLGMGILVEVLDRRVRSAEDLHVILDAPVLGIFPKDGVKHKGVRSVGKKSSQLRISKV